MYMVVSKWAIHPGKETEWESESQAVRNKMRDVPGIEFVHGFKNEAGEVVVAMGYTDEPTYQSVIHAEDGPFSRIMQEHRLEDFSSWVSSERGEAFG